MYTNNKLAKSIRLALMFGAAATAVTGAAVAQDEQQEEEERAERVERIQVTGSRIQRTDMEGALPVTVIDRESIELSGEISVADLLRNTTFNSAGSFRPQSGSSAQGVSMINMRGLGSSRTLVLVDGRRLTMSPSTGSSQDLNSIPMGAVERIEILSDGASAVYGSDAIGGVINVITRRDFSGVEATIGAAEVSVPREGGDRENGSVVFGSASDTTRIIGGVSWNKREIIFENAFPWVQPGASTYGNNFINFGDGRTAAIPGGCNDANFFESADGSRCLYNFNATNANEASTSNESLFVKADHQINDDWSFYSNASVAKTSSFGRYAPAPDINHPVFYDNLLTPTDSYNNPTNPDSWFYDPNNPNAVVYNPDVVGPLAPVAIYHRFAAMGNRDSDVDNENLDFLVGFEGRAFGLDLDFGWRRVRNKTYEIGNGYLAAQTAWSNVNNFNPGYCDDGSFDPDSCRFGYDIQNPSDNPQNVLDAGVVTTSRISSFDINEFYGSAGFDVMEIGGGMIQGFVGLEHREEVYADIYDSQSAAGLVGGSSGSSAGGSRDVTAAYFEFLLPVTYDLELSLAGRFDDYSDYGSDFSPKVSFRYQPMDNLLIRGSYGLGFRAPTLDILTQQRSFSADSVNDPITCQAFTGGTSDVCQINAFVIANPELESEDSTQYSFGVAYQPTDWLNFTVDYYNINIENRIRAISSQQLINLARAGEALPPGTEVNFDAQNRIVSVTRGFVNEGDLDTSGIDINLRTNFDFGSAGRLVNNLYMSHMLDYSLDGGRNLVRDPGVPRQRININNSYMFSDFTFAWNINIIGNQYNTVTSDASNPDGVVRAGHIGTWTTHDLQASYDAPWDGRFTVGVQNAFEKLPQFGTSAAARGSRDYNFNLYNAFGRITYVRYTQRF
ncbi:TonB-dependent receptor plug domain-containing protein [Aliidiomarina indica]|uniref:TonB-dependent receptor plug domain-containing protein n=1 Tax=Aliidiomarina indica TaxID=2749147 RepID=UPI00188FF74A|nr:TonB-dependent receptor [Aliidiomarina indica]